MPKQKPKRASKRQARPPTRFTPSSSSPTANPAASPCTVTPIHQSQHDTPLPQPQSPYLRIQHTVNEGSLVRQLERRIQDLENSLSSPATQPTESNRVDDGKPRSNFIASSALPLHMSIDKELASKASEGEYIPMQALSPHLDPDQKRADRRPLSVVGWTRGYIRLMSQLISTNTATAQDMLIHLDNVLTLAQDRHQWITYDAEFRRQQVNAGYSYSHTRVELYSKAVANQQPFRSNQTTHPARRPPPGYCFRYHTPEQRCELNPCPYLHKCPTCGAKHPLFACYRARAPKPDQHDDQKDKKSSKKD